MNVYSKYLGIPYKDKGRDFSSVDCYGLVYLIYQEEYKIELPDFQGTEYVNDYANLWKKIEKEELKERDVILFRTSRTSDAVTHIGLFVGDGKFINCLEGNSGVVLDRLERPYFLKHFYGAFRYVGEK